MKLRCSVILNVACIVIPTGIYAQIIPSTANERMLGMRIKKELENNSAINATFRSIGPSIMGGRVADIDANPANPIEFYVAYASGSVWYTKNNGQTFIPIFDSVDVFSIGNIAVNWKDRIEQRTIWIGSGDASSSGASYAGTGIYKSSDNGISWQWMGLPESHHIGKIILHPHNSSIVWVAAVGHLYSSNKERGVYKTSDAGKTWQQVLYVDDSTGCVDIDINPQNPDELYAAVWYRARRVWASKNAGKSSGIYRTTDGGKNWKLITAGSSGFPTGDGVGRIGVAVAPSNPKIVYAVVDNKSTSPNGYVPDWIKDLEAFNKSTKEGFLKIDDKKLDDFLERYKGKFPRKYNSSMVKKLVNSGNIKPSAIYDHLYMELNDLIGTEIYRSDNGGQTWKETRQERFSFDEGMGFYFGKIYVSPNNENKIWLLSVSLMVSNNGGKTFEGADNGYNVHTDHHALWINPQNDNHLIDGNDGGVNISYDNGDNWFKVMHPCVAQYYSVSTDNKLLYNIYGGLQDDGVWVGRSNNKEDLLWTRVGAYPFRKIAGGDGTYVEVDSRDNNTIYYGLIGGLYERSEVSEILNSTTIGAKADEEQEEAYESAPEQMQRSINKEGEPVRIQIRAKHDLGEPQLRLNWLAPILLSKHNQDILYYGSNRFHRSLNKGDSLINLSGDLTNGRKNGYKNSYATITSITESPLRFGLLYVGTDDGNVQLSKDGGYTWELVGSPSAEEKNIKEKNKITDTRLNTQGLWVSRVIASKYKEGRVYVTLNGRYFDHFLPYLYVSDDYGKTWKQIGKSLPCEPINVIKEDPRVDSLIYIGTDGGLYVSHNAGDSFMIWNKGLPRSIPVSDIAIQERENEIVLATFGRSLYVAKLQEVQQLGKEKY